MEMDPPDLRHALTEENPLQIVGTINAYTALLAKAAGFRAIYLSGAGVANASHGLPDLAMTNLNDVLDDVYRIREVCDLPLLVDADTGFGNALSISRTVKSLIAAKASALHIEDQVIAKRCGHRPNKELVDKNEMCERIKACVDARTDAKFVIMARTDALSVFGLNDTIERIHAYVDAGADMIFCEGAKTLEEYAAITSACKIPVLANITEFGLTPLFHKDELKKAGIQLILYPLTAFRVMNAAAMQAYQTIRDKGTQASLISQMQTREELYKILHYYDFEKKLDEITAQGK